MFGKKSVLTILGDKRGDFLTENKAILDGDEYYQILLKKLTLDVALLNNENLCISLGMDPNQVLEEAQRIAPIINAVKLLLPSVEELEQTDSYHK